MIRLILFVILALFLVVGGLAVALYQYFGWKGLIVFPFILLALVWLAKIVIGKLVKRFALGLFGMKAGVLKGAAMNVHSVRSIPKPAKPEVKPNEAETSVGAETPADKEEDDSEPDKPEPPKDYLEVDVTITPKGEAGHSVWEPSELMLTSEKIRSLADLENKEVGTTHSVEIWNGTSFGPDDPGKYPGEQRLKIVFAVKPATTEAWLHYYHEPIGRLKFPPGTIDI
jgi:hypothetical protein